MNMKDLLRRFREADAPDSRWRRLSKLLLNTTWSFFIAIVVFIVASYILLPHFLHQESELKRLRQEIDALNEALNSAQGMARRADETSDEVASDEKQSVADGTESLPGPEAEKDARAVNSTRRSTQP